MHDIDEIMLGFSPEQYKKYLSLLERSGKEAIELDASIFECEDAPSFSPSELVVLASSLDRVAREFIEAINVKDSFFSHSALNANEARALAEKYYRAVSKIDEISTQISAYSAALAKDMQKAERSFDKSIASYHSLLPYKAALGDDPLYRDKLCKAEERITRCAEEHQAVLTQMRHTMSVIGVICEESIPLFLSKSARAIGLPPYEELSATDTYSATKIFIEQISNQVKRLSE